MHIVFAILSLLIPICFQCLWSTSHIMFPVIMVNCYTCICFNAIFRKKMHCVSWQTCYKTFTYIFISKRYFYVWPDPKSCKIRKISVWIQFLKTLVNGFSLKIRNIIASITISDVTTVYAYNTQDKTTL